MGGVLVRWSDAYLKGALVAIGLLATTSMRRLYATVSQSDQKCFSCICAHLENKDRKIICFLPLFFYPLGYEYSTTTSRHPVRSAANKLSSLRMSHRCLRVLAVTKWSALGTRNSSQSSTSERVGSRLKHNYVDAGIAKDYSRLSVDSDDGSARLGAQILLSHNVSHSHDQAS